MGCPLLLFCGGRCNGKFVLTRAWQHFVQFWMASP